MLSAPGAEETMAPPQMAEKQERDLRVHQGWAALTWIGTGLYLIDTTRGISFFSLKTLGFFLIGTVPAGLVFGSAAYIAHRRICRLFTIRSERSAAVFASTVGLLLFVVNGVICYLAARWVVARMVV
jgi:hypothetical protein